MESIFFQFDPNVVLIVMVPLGLAVAALLFRLSCNMCSVTVPDFWHSVLVILFLVVVHIVLRFWLNVTHVPHGINSQFIVPIVASALVVAISLRTGPLAAMRVTLVQGAIYGALYIGVALIGVLTNGLHSF